MFAIEDKCAAGSRIVEAEPIGTLLLDGCAGVMCSLAGDGFESCLLRLNLWAGCCGFAQGFCSRNCSSASGLLDDS